MRVKAKCMKCEAYIENQSDDSWSNVVRCPCQHSRLGIDQHMNIIIKGFCEIKYVTEHDSGYVVIQKPIVTIKKRRSRVKKTKLLCKTCGEETEGTGGRVTCFSCKEKRNRKEAYKAYLRNKNGLINKKQAHDKERTTAL